MPASDGQEVRPGLVLTLESLLVNLLLFFFNWQYCNASCFTVTSSRCDSLNNENELPVPSPGYDQFLWQLQSNKNVSIILAACCWKAEEQALPVIGVVVGVRVKSTSQSLQVTCWSGEPMYGVDTLSSGCVGDDMSPGLLCLCIASVYMYVQILFCGSIDIYI